jgi:hypothetical protein
MRKRTGIRNRYRSHGSGTYCRQTKRLTRDRYGTYVNGKQTDPENINGRSIWWRNK